MTLKGVQEGFKGSGSVLLLYICDAYPDCFTLYLILTKSHTSFVHYSIWISYFNEIIFENSKLLTYHFLLPKFTFEDYHYEHRV